MRNIDAFPHQYVVKLVGNQERPMKPQQAADLGAYLRQARSNKDLSTRALAALVGVDMATIVRVERGEFASPRPDTLKAMAEALGLPLADVFAMADYVIASELPSTRPYMRAKYPDLPDAAVEQVDRYIERLVKRHGSTLTGPALGEDEH
jgi:transcriptional regulator with XRE-family HTH domain